MSTMRTWGKPVAAAVMVGCGLTACAAGRDDMSPTPAAQVSESPSAILSPQAVETAVDEGARLIDVRTPDEYAAGHLRGSLNIDLAAPDFDDLIGRLDPKRSYIVYCASGNRAGQAVQQMTDMGFVSVENGGGFTELASLLPTQAS